MKPNNPFVTSGYRGPEYFCDRVAETGKIVSALTNERNVTLMAPRRYGKTGLVHNVFNSLPSDYATVYIDIYATSNLQDFTQMFANAVLGALDSVADKSLAAVGKFFKAVIAILMASSYSSFETLYWQISQPAVTGQSSVAHFSLLGKISIASFAVIVSTPIYKLTANAMMRSGLCRLKSQKAPTRWTNPVIVVITHSTSWLLALNRVHRNLLFQRLHCHIKSRFCVDRYGQAF